ncbi:putative hydrolase [Pseudomonas chlororaphis subsp. aurantiaca]|uniref:M20 aminoacylase family protein n=1 Tax=Pseudomonas chlororaphis TaxID=587753 RepID=UPI0008661DE7|nr:M20 aminoacylase family protein [Pseudomonas chlororaphis]BAV75840.1 putative hydrolase [Pseudomonas chlororaphis subsp. aurantiaca]
MNPIQPALIPQILAWQNEFAQIRQRIHQHPELGFEEQRTSQLVATYLRQWGYSVHTGIGGTGVVGVLKCGNSSKSIGIRADMDALPIHEESGVPYCSQQAGKMHACGHDGHTAILLCAARYLAKTQQFDGTVNLIFQPAEETLGGAKRMIEENLFQRFPCDAVYALHNMPGLPVGIFLTQAGAMSASSDVATIRLIGVGGHGAMPHKAKDPVVASAELVLALQSIVARNVPAGEVGVITVGSLQAGEAHNVIPDVATLKISVRSTNPDIRKLLRKRITEISQGVAQGHDLTLDLHYDERIGVLLNTAKETTLLQNVARELVGNQAVLTTVPSGYLGSEDFAAMLEVRPGCYIVLGNGNSGPSGCMVHNPGYDFNDQAIPFGASLWARLVETYLSEA